jgi:two-component system sensor kinase FixL
MLALMHLVIWIRNRGSWANLWFFIAVLGVVGLAACEMVTMGTLSPEVFAAGIRNGHMIYILAVVGILGFVHCHFGTGSLWLLWLTIALRVLAIIANFTTGQSLHVAEVRTLRRMDFLGETVSVLGDWEPNRWIVLGQLASLAMLIYLIDASWRLWRTGSPEGRCRAAALGGSLSLFIIFATIQSALVANGVLKMPFLVSLPILGMVLAMGYELSRDVLRAALLSSELATSKERLRRAAAATRLALWEWHIGTNDLWVSDEGRALYGLDLQGPGAFDKFITSLHPDDWPAVKQAVARAVTGPEPYAAEYRVVLPDGSVRWIAAEGRVERDAHGRANVMRGVSIDITERREAEERFRRVIEAAPNAMVMIDGAGRIALVNSQAERVFGYTRDEMLGSPLEILIPQRLHSHHPELRESYQAHPTAREMNAGQELFGIRKDGSEVAVEIGLNPIEMPEGRFVLASIIDITDRKRAERESARQQQELAHLSRISILGELSGALAHELNQPLAAILGNAQVGSGILRNQPPDLDEMTAILGDIADDAKRAGGIIHGMRAMFKKDSVTDAQQVNLNESVTQVLNLLHSEIVSRKVKLETRLEPGLPTVSAGRVEIQQVLINLIMNALDAMKGMKQGASLEISTCHTDGQVRLGIRDHGQGISADMIERLFEPFVSTKHGGLGLGLAISRSIVQRFRGELRAENDPAGGAQFHLTLPATPDEDKPCQ